MFVNLGSLVSRMKETLLPALTGPSSSNGESAARATQQLAGRAGIAAEPPGCVLFDCCLEGHL
jgi:hypothetical protein